jgi:hypothetical protein
MQSWREVQRLYVKKYMVECDEQVQLQCNQINTMLQLAGNPMFSSDMRYQTPSILDLGAKKSDIPTIQAYQDHTYFPKVFKLGETQISQLSINRKELSMIYHRLRSWEP